MQDRLHNKRVMVIDDIFEGEFLYSVLLDRIGCKVAFYDDPLLALQDVKSVKPQLIVSDVCLPNIDGYTMLKAVRCLFPKIPFLMVSATPNYLEAAGFIDNCKILAKPFENLVFMNMVQGSLNEPHAMNANRRVRTRHVTRFAHLRNVPSGGIGRHAKQETPLVSEPSN